MAAGNTYVPIATQTLGSAAASVTFSSIPATYTDLVLVVSAFPSSTAAGHYTQIQIGNGSVDTGSNYSDTALLGDGSTASSYRDAPTTSFWCNSAGANMQSATSPLISTINIMNYANTTTYKTALIRSGNPAGNLVYSDVALWRSTVAIDVIKIFISVDNFTAGSTFNLYGIKAA